MRRRTFLRAGLFAAAALLLKGSPAFDRFVETAQAATANLLHDTLNGLLAFVVPGPDAYSVAQGVTTAEPGGVDAQVTEVLLESLDFSAPYVPNFSSIVAAILNNLALAVNKG